MGQIAAAWEGGGECCKEYSHEHSQNDLGQAPAPCCSCNSENVLRIATNNHRASLENAMTVGFPLLHRIGGVYGRAEEILDSHTKSMEMLWVR